MTDQKLPEYQRRNSVNKHLIVKQKNMKNVKLFEEFINEKSTIYDGASGISPIINVIMQEFANLPVIKNIKYDRKSALRILKREWPRFEKRAQEIAVEEVKKAVGKLANINFITYQHSDWSLHAQQGLRDRAQFWFKLKKQEFAAGPYDFGIQIDVNLDKDPGIEVLKKKDFKFKNTPATTVPSKGLIYGKMDDSKGHNFRLNDTSMIIVGDDEKEFQI